MSTILIIEWFASVTTVIGAALLAYNFRYSAWGWVFFLIANVFWLTYAIMATDAPITVQTTVLTVTSIIGVYRWLLKPRMEAT